MAQKCEYAKVNNFGKLNCTVGENQLCSFQRYCSQASEWQNSKAFSTCERRGNVGNKKKNVDLIDTIKDIEIEKNVLQDKEQEIENNSIEVNEGNNINIQNVSKSIEVENNFVSESPKAPKANRKAKEFKKKGKVVGLGKVSVIVVDENGNSMRLYNKPNAKIGDIIEL